MKPNLFEEEICDHVLLVDGHNLIFRVVNAAQSELDKEKMTDPEFTFFKIYFMNALKTLIEKFNPTRVIVAIDPKNGWRKGVYKEYKAKRKAARDSSKVDFEAFFKVLDPFLEDFKKAFQNIEVLKIDEAEGDDVIAVACQNIKSRITIVSVDKDFYQLQIFKNVSQYHPIERAMKKSLNPMNDLQTKIIGGDENDNIPAIYPRCGPKSVEAAIKNNFIYNLHDEEYIKDEKNYAEIIKKCKIEPKQILENYVRNTQLIDFKHIPQEIVNRILNELNNPVTKKFDGRKFMSFLVKHNLKPILDRAQDFTNSLGRIWYKNDSI